MLVLCFVVAAIVGSGSRSSAVVTFKHDPLTDELLSDPEFRKKLYCRDRNGHVSFEHKYKGETYTIKNARAARKQK
jgi:hypothetical protein